MGDTSVNVDNMSDAEIRSKLMEYGFPVMPVTGTTRKIMKKKLKLLMENKKPVNADGRRSLALGQYSSEEDSDNEIKAVKNKRRVTMAAPIKEAPKPLVKKTTRIVETTIEEDVPVKKTTRTNVSFGTRSSKMVEKANQEDEYDIGSESDSEVTANMNGNNFVEERNASTGKSHGSFKSLEGSYSKTFSTSERPAAYSSPVTDFDSASERLNQIRSRLSLGNTDHRPAPNVEKSETPYLSNFTRRLSQLSSTKSDAVKEHDSNGTGSQVYRRAGQFSSFRSTIRPRDYQYNSGSRFDGKVAQLKDNIVPVVVLGLAVFFFLVVGFVYLGMRHDTSLEPAGRDIPICDPKNSTHVRGVNCVLNDDVKLAAALFKAIKPEIEKRAVKHCCDDPSVAPYLREEEIVQFVMDKFRVKNETRIWNDLRNLEVLIMKNPLWDVSLVQNRENEKIFKLEKIESLETLGFERVSNPIFLAILNPSLPWSCIIRNAISFLVKSAIFFIAVFSTLVVANLGHKYWKQQKQQTQNEIVSLVEKILDVLQANYEEKEDNYFVINHIRDMIIPVQERKEKDKIWKGAVKFINENESRIRTEVQVVQGEEYHVWRWIGAANLSCSSSPKRKSWQGQAFETQSGSANSLQCSPTPCLKIRGMVDDADRDVSAIREAVLAKCASKCRVLHCAVDPAMKCVYVKCQDKTDAAVVYRNMHGWWYAGQLVTVKYLRLERYMQRFPDSAVSGPPYLKPTQAVNDNWTN